jgi:SAM-dependent methyltransferase
MKRRLTPRRLASAGYRRLPRAPLRFVMPARLWGPLFRLWLSTLAADPNRRRAARELLVAYDDVYSWLDRVAVTYDDGVHVKHRLTRYHDFFVERVRDGERVLDVGSGKGELAYDLVTRAGATVVGIDNDPTHVSFARRTFVHDRLEFRQGDVLTGLPDGHFDVVVMSNVLEHVAPRVELLRRIVAGGNPSRLLLRVPLYARDWTVPFKAELGLRAYWEPDHETEYDPETFRSELQEAGLRVTELSVQWGEIWAAAEPS